MARLSLPSIDKVPGGREFASLSRRVRTLIVAAVLFVVLFVLTLTLSVPYVILSPGPTYNTLGTDDNGRVIVMLDGRKAATTSGHLNLTTVSVTTDRVDAFRAIVGWLEHDQVVVPETAIRQPGESEEQERQQDATDFTVSQDNATAAALCELGYPKRFGVAAVVRDGPSDGVLAPGDVFVSVDGKAADSDTKLRAIMQSETPGKTVPVVVERQSASSTTPQQTNLQVKLGSPPKGQKGALLGVELENGCLAPFSVTIGLNQKIGGPSAGLMFALGIIDKVGKFGDLTGGKFIAGTGTITPSGQVGPIGGIQLKMIAARDHGASVFLAPVGNCSDVRGDTPSGLKVIKVDTLQHALQYLKDVQENKPVPSC